MHQIIFKYTSCSHL